MAVGERVGGVADNGRAGVGVVADDGRAGVGVVASPASSASVVASVRTVCSSQPESGSAVTSPVYLFTCENIFCCCFGFLTRGVAAG